ncbi:MAG: transposase [Tepidisphaeraceae bacterium]
MKTDRMEWHGLLADVPIDDLVFVDEFSATTNMTRAWARGPVGERVACKAPHGHWKVISTIAAMTTHGMLCCGTFDGATDTDTFVEYVAVLAQQLRPGQVVVLDNLAPHWSPRVDELIEAAGVTCCVFRRTRRTSIRSRWRSRRSKRCCGSWSRERSKRYRPASRRRRLQ